MHLLQNLSNTQASFARTLPSFSNTWLGVEPLRENRKLSQELDKLGQVFEKNDCVFVITGSMFSQSATVRNNIDISIYSLV